MKTTRREMMTAVGLSTASVALGSGQPMPPPRASMGVVIHSYGLRRAAGKADPFAEPLPFLQFCESIGAGGMQTALGSLDDGACDRLREYASSRGLYVEGSISLPKDDADVPRFETEVRVARRCGAEVFRTVQMSGRRYEVFRTAQDFLRFRDESGRALERARKVVEKHEVRMAVENHKDFTAAELVERIERLNSPFIGVCLDTGNNLALLEPPEETIKLLAPLAFTTHVKDMGVEECEDGFLIAEVPLGQGILDLPAAAAMARKSHPKIRFNLEMITRDPLTIPCLTPRYWATLEHLPGRRLAEALRMARRRSAQPALPRVSSLPREDQLRRENDHVLRSLEYWRDHLGL